MISQNSFPILKHFQAIYLGCHVCFFYSLSLSVSWQVTAKYLDFAKGSDDEARKKSMS